MQAEPWRGHDFIGSRNVAEGDERTRWKSPPACASVGRVVQEHLRQRGCHLLADNRPLSAVDRERIDTIVTQVGRMIDARDRIVAEHDIDRVFAIPSGLWDRNSPTRTFLDDVEAIRRGPPEGIEYLRFRCWNFTGWHPRYFTILENMVGPGPSVDDFDEWFLHHRLHAPERNAYARLVWSLRAHTPRAWWVHQPRVLGEVGWDLNGEILNHDTWTYQERMTLFYNLGLTPEIARRSVTRPCTRILEIGAGYGALAYQWTRNLDRLTYVICDLPETLLFSGVYLAVTAPKRELRVVDDPNMPLDEPGCIYLLPNYLLPSYVERTSVDLAINTLSLSEMSAHQVHSYGRMVSQMIGTDGAFYEQNLDLRAYGCVDATTLLMNHFDRPYIPRFAPFPVSLGQPVLWTNVAGAAASARRGQAPLHASPKTDIQATH